MAFYFAVVLTSGMALLVVAAISWRRQARFRHWRDEQFAVYRRDLATWQAAKREHEERERTRLITARRWLPVAANTAWRRVDVVGGTGPGWASLIATLSSSALAGGHAVSILDLGSNHVASGLDELARSHAIPVAVPEITAASIWSQIADLGADVLSELVADVASDLREETTTEQRYADAEIVRSLVAEPGVRTSLPDLVHALDQHPSAESRFLHSMLRPLASERGAHDVTHGLPASRPDGLLCLAFDSYGRMRPEVLRLLMLHGFTRQLDRAKWGAQPGDVLVVGGPLELSTRTIQRLVDVAARRGMRLVTLSQTFTASNERWVGGGDAVIVMRLGTAPEAEMAARLIGKEHHFTYSGLTVQIGDALARGTSTGEGGQRGTTATAGLGVPFSASVGLARTRIHTWQETKTLTATASQSVSQELSRTYEFMVEPARIQQLLDTAFILVDSLGAERQPVLADCNPGLALVAHPDQHLPAD